MKDAYYFSHDSNAKDDPKCIMLIEQLGLEGYGIFWVLIETLRDQPEHKYPLNLIPAIARRFNTTTEKMNVVVNNYGLFIIENEEFFYSKSLNERMLLVDQRREQTSLAGQKGMKTRWGNASITALDNTVITPLLQTDNSDITKKGKERKVKEKKVEENKVKSTYMFFDNTELNNTFLSFIDYRISIKAKMTDRAIELMIAKLKKECDSDGERIETLNNSILNGWKGIFIKKETKYPQKKSTKDNFEQREYTDEFLESLYFNAKEEK